MNLPNGSIFFGLAAGAVWSSLNLVLLKQLAPLLSHPAFHRRRLIFLLVAKFGGLYPLGIWILWSRVVSLGAFVVGFTAILIGFAFRAVVPSFSRGSHV